MSEIVVTADDFGLAIEVNEAVEIAYTRGVLTSASLMVGARAVDDAVRRARRLPALRVGLHVVLVDGHPVLPAIEVPDLVDSEGRFRTDMARLGMSIFLRPSVRRQVVAEIEAQFSAFAATGLTLDHVNAHKHFHLHPTIAHHVLRIGRRYGVRTIRVPHEPASHVRRIDPSTPAAPRLWPYTTMLRRRLRGLGIASADRVYGLAWSGAMTAERLTALLRVLPSGHNEIYLHPATSDRFEGACAGYGYAAELDALTSASAIQAMAASRARLSAPGATT